MRKADVEVREVVCSETGKPMPKIPLWMADVKVKFISDEARQKHPTAPGLTDIEPLRRSAAASSDLDALKSIDAVGVVIDDVDADFEDADVEAEEVDDDFEA